MRQIIVFEAFFFHNNLPFFLLALFLCVFLFVFFYHIYSTIDKIIKRRECNVFIFIYFTFTYCVYVVYKGVKNSEMQ